MDGGEGNPSLRWLAPMRTELPDMILPGTSVASP